MVTIVIVIIIINHHHHPYHANAAKAHLTPCLHRVIKLLDVIVIDVLNLGIIVYIKCPC